MINKLPQLVFTIAILASVFFCEHAVSAKDETLFTGDVTATSLAKSYTVLEVRQAIEMVRAGDYAKAFPILETYAAKGDLGASYILGKLYAFGLGVEKSTVAATKLFAKNAEGGHTPSMMAIAQISQVSNPGVAIYMIKQAASAGDVAAMAELGSVYENGKLGVSKNPKLAFDFYQKASEAGNVIGDFHLARLYDQGVGVSENAVQATRLYRKAALGGVVPANAIMAKRYFEGIGLETDPIAALGWLTRGAQNGLPEAMVVLGERYELGDTLKQDLNQAGRLYSQAAQMGDASGAYKLATLYLSGKGTKRDPVRAYVLLSGAQSLPKAQRAMEELKKTLSADELKQAQQQVDKIAAERAAKSADKK